MTRSGEARHDVVVDPAFEAVDGQYVPAPADVNRAVDIDHIRDGDPARLGFGRRVQTPPHRDFSDPPAEPGSERTRPGKQRSDDETPAGSGIRHHWPALVMIISGIAARAESVEGTAPK
jgi:hypothetical protein